MALLDPWPPNPADGAYEQDQLGYDDKQRNKDTGCDAPRRGVDVSNASNVEDAITAEPSILENHLKLAENIHNTILLFYILFKLIIIANSPRSINYPQNNLP